jgi:hypothetical protein
MNKDEKRISYIIFKNKILENSEQSYENFFIEVMCKYNSNFQPVKPQGRIGDKKNDGFDKETGTYYQVYAPEDIKKREGKAISKLAEDFEGLLGYWQNISPIKSFFYVLHDKYQGAYPSIHKELAELERVNAIICKTFLNKDLENIFWQLDDDKIFSIIGSIPTPYISDIEFVVLREVIEFLMRVDVEYIKANLPTNIDFNGKIVFNKLSEIPANFLTFGNYQRGNVEEYFKIRSDFQKEDLRLRFVDLYNEGLELIPNSDEKNDFVFFHILEKASPNKTKAIKDAVIVLMAYYFECCDIFEEPKL